MYRKIIAISGVAALALGLAACGEAAPAPVEVAVVETVTTPEAPAAVEETSELTAVEKQFVATFRIAVPEDTTSDEDLVKEAWNKTIELRDFLDNGGTSQEFLAAIGADPANAVRSTAIVTGALALDTSLKDHPNF